MERVLETLVSKEKYMQLVDYSKGPMKGLKIFKYELSSLPKKEGPHTPRVYDLENPQFLLLHPKRLGTNSKDRFAIVSWILLYLLPYANNISMKQAI